MALKETLGNTLRTAMKSGDKERVALTRYLLAQIQNREIEKHGRGENAVLTDEEIVEVFQKEVKKRTEAVALFRKGNRNDLADSEEKEIALIREYLPAELDASEIEAVVDKLMEGGLADFNSLMREAMKQLKGRVDGRKVGEIIKRKIGG